MVNNHSMSYENINEENTVQEKALRRKKNGFMQLTQSRLRKV
jgi:hypothetical protein